MKTILLICLILFSGCLGFRELPENTIQLEDNNDMVKGNIKKEMSVSIKAETVCIEKGLEVYGAECRGVQCLIDCKNPETGEITRWVT